MRLGLLQHLRESGRPRKPGAAPSQVVLLVVLPRLICHTSQCVWNQPKSATAVWEASKHRARTEAPFKI